MSKLSRLATFSSRRAAGPLKKYRFLSKLENPPFTTSAAIHPIDLNMSLEELYQSMSCIYSEEENLAVTMNTM